MDFHEIATIFPMLDEAGIHDLAKDIAANGLLCPLTVYEGKILDGRNRYLACQLVNVQPIFSPFVERDPLQFVISANLKRRHLSESQRAVIAQRLANLQVGDNQYTRGSANLPTLTQSEAADLLNVGARSIRTVASIERALPELIPHIEKNIVSVHAAKQIVDMPDVCESLKNGDIAVEEAQRRIAKPHVAHNSGDNEWYTPQDYIDRAVVVMGGIDCDPASTAEANAVVQAIQFYTAEEDGLTQPWAGRVWMNPPYTAELIGKFVEKLLASADVTEAIVLVNNATETKWFQALARHATAVCFPVGRVKFWHPRKEATPLQGQAVLYLGERPGVFCRYFSDVGVTWVK